MSHSPSTSVPLDPNQIIAPAPTRGTPVGGAHADDGTAGRAQDIATGAAGMTGSAGVSSASAGAAGGQELAGAAAPQASAGQSGMNSSGAGAAGQGEIAGQGTGGAEAGSAGHAGTSGAGTSGHGGAAGMRGTAGTVGNTTPNFNELIDKLSDALTSEQRARIVLALQTNSVTPDQLNELLDAVTRAGACESDHQTCQQMCSLVLNACPTCLRDRTMADAERAMCAAL